MKKVFAILSTLLLTIACIGVSVKNMPAQAASDKITADPTLAADEIPVYIMNSIMSTFPNYYDNDANPDTNWQGVSRMYPWNETRLRVAQLDGKGQPTGKYYAIYFAGHTVAVEKNGDKVIGAGKNILFWNVDENGNVVAEKYSDGKKASGGQASDPSLSHMRTNISGKDITFDPTKVGLGDGEGTNFYNRSIIFDGLGRPVRGIALDGVYTSAEPAEGEIKFAPEYCRVNGVVTKIAEGVTCDKAMVEKLDEEGNVVLDENGEPVMVPSDKDDLIYSRFVWEYFAEQPTNVNTVPYLSEGWDAMLWDYCYPVEDGGYMAIAFVGTADNSAHVVKGDQLEPYKATLTARYVAGGMTAEEAAAKAEKDAAAPRACVQELRIPAGGFTFDFGYLDRGKGVCDEAFNSTVINGYLYGRTLITKLDQTTGKPVVDAEGNEVKIGLAEQRVYNFSVSDIRFDEKVIDGASYRLVNTSGMNVVEVMQGNKFNPAKNINYNGVMRYWNVEDYNNGKVSHPFLTYKASVEALDLYISESFNGSSAVSVVEPATGYMSMNDVLVDFVKDYNIFLAEKDGYALNAETGKYEKTNEDGTIAVFADKLKVPAVDWTDEQIVADWYTPLGWDLCSTGGNAATFVNINKWWTKWSWVFSYIAQNAESNNASIVISGEGDGNRFVSSPGFFRDALYGFFTESPSRSIAGTWANTCGDWSNGKATKWLDARTNAEKWNDYTIDASTKAVNDNWTVTYRVVNRDTKVEKSYTVKYVVVDSYTPVITFNKNKLTYTPKVIGDLIQIDPINKYDIVKAYDGQYNGTDILGSDISQNIVFDTDLDFDNPTQGKHQVVATIKNNAGTKQASVKFVVNVVDIEAPFVLTRTVTIQQGQDFDPRDGITLAYDAVDGNLFDANYEWWYQTSPAKPVDTNNLNGTDRKINISVEVSDRAGNIKEAKYQLVIIASKTASDAISQLDKKVDELQDSLDSILDAIDELDAKVTSSDTNVTTILQAITALTEKVNAIESTVGGSNENITAIRDAITALTQKVNAIDELNTKMDANDEKLNAIKTNVEKVNNELATVKTAVDGVQTDVDTLENTVTGVKTTVDGLKNSGGCKNGALIVIGLSSLIAVAAVLLKKRH